MEYLLECLVFYNVMFLSICLNLFRLFKLYLAFLSGTIDNENKIRYEWDSLVSSLFTSQCVFSLNLSLNK